VVILTEKKTLTEDRPEVFFSGALHDERVGPNVVIEALRLLCENYASGTNAWLKRLVQTRTIVLIPMANAWGYYHNKRTEGAYDHNRDFPINREPTDCMVTITGRTVNEVFREHLFQLAITFHPGSRFIAFEWGTSDHLAPHDKSPDHFSQYGICKTLSEWAGKTPDGETFFPFGTINSEVHPAIGRMEDWSYASSWLDNLTGNHTFQSCAPSTYGGYAPEKTEYNDAVLRCFSILIGAADNNLPLNKEHGSSEEVFEVDGVPMNIRLLLLTADLVQPYVVILEHRLIVHHGMLRAKLK